MDDPTKRGRADAAKVSMQMHELRYLAEKFGVDLAAARLAQTLAGPDRRAVEELLSRIGSGHFMANKLLSNVRRFRGRGLHSGWRVWNPPKNT